MIFNKNGDMFVYEDKMFIIGEEVFASESAYAGLLGRIKEIRTGDDRKTENEGTDIYCAFREPILRLDAELLSKLRISNEDASIDEIMILGTFIGALVSLVMVSRELFACNVPNPE